MEATRAPAQPVAAGIKRGSGAPVAGGAGPAKEETVEAYEARAPHVYVVTSETRTFVRGFAWPARRIEEEVFGTSAGARATGAGPRATMQRWPTYSWPGRWASATSASTTLTRTTISGAGGDSGKKNLEEKGIEPIQLIKYAYVRLHASHLLHIGCFIY